ncbi:MAG TPA: hypothetical protein VGN72_01200 [Tepidisphaeraceae bacterium]|jgi:hypothetical protein|nr:hypothetical protein [Tepidisphaeraceae bacterium]
MKKDANEAAETIEVIRIHRCPCGGEMMEWSAAQCFGGDADAGVVLRCPRCRHTRSLIAANKPR